VYPSVQYVHVIALSVMTDGNTAVVPQQSLHVVSVSFVAYKNDIPFSVHMIKSN